MMLLLASELSGDGDELELRRRRDDGPACGALIVMGRDMGQERI